MNPDFVDVQLEEFSEKHKLKPNDFELESHIWLNSPEAEPSLPPYDWGEEEEPEGEPIHYQPGLGLVVGD